MAACSDGQRLRKPSEVEPLSDYTLNEENYQNFLTKLSAFSSKFSEEYVSEFNTGDNVSLSPVSMYMCLALLAECTDGNTREEILTALNLSMEEVREYTKILYAASSKDYYVEETSGKTLLQTSEHLTNSIWMDKSLTADSTSLDVLASQYYCYSYKTDFSNTSANKAIRSFIKKQTKGVIDEKTEFSTDTLFTLINTLYLKDVWNYAGDDMKLTSTAYDFKNTDGSTTNTFFLEGKYIAGRALSKPEYTSFYTETLRNYRIKFVVPKAGYKIEDIFTAENINLINLNTDYRAVDENNWKYYTRCLFPEFKASGKADVSNLLSKRLNIKSLFNDSCELSFTENEAFCGQIAHNTELAVNRKGILGAAATVSTLLGDGGPQNYIYKDFIVDKSFGYILTDRYNVPLFCGIVNKI